MIWDKSYSTDEQMSVGTVARISLCRSYLEGACDDRLTGDYAGKNGKYQTRPKHPRWNSQVEGVFPSARNAAYIRSLSNILSNMKISTGHKSRFNISEQRTYPNQEAWVYKTAPRNLNGPGDILAGARNKKVYEWAYCLLNAPRSANKVSHPVKARRIPPSAIQPSYPFRSRNAPA